MRILFLGQKPIGEKCFNILLNNQNEYYTVVGAVSNFEKCVWWESNKIYDICKKNGLLFIDNKEPNEDLIAREIENKNIDFLISVGHNWILSKNLLEKVSYNAINLHLAKLPDYKGYFSYNHAILNDEKTYGVTLHWMTEKVDKGDCLLKGEFLIESDDTAYTLYKKSLCEGKKIFEELVSLLSNDKELPRKKIEKNFDGIFYSKHSLEGLRKITDIQNVEEVKKKARAFSFPPFENAYIEMDGKKYYVIPERQIKAEKEDNSSFIEKSPPPQKKRNDDMFFWRFNKLWSGYIRRPWMGDTNCYVVKECISRKRDNSCQYVR